MGKWNTYGASRAKCNREVVPDHKCQWERRAFPLELEHTLLLITADPTYWVPFMVLESGICLDHWYSIIYDAFNLHIFHIFMMMMGSKRNCVITPSFQSVTKLRGDWSFPVFLCVNLIKTHTHTHKHNFYSRESHHNRYVHTGTHEKCIKTHSCYISDSSHM